MSRSFPFYTQSDIVDCGPACLRMIISYYGKSFSMQELREKAGVGRTGTSLLGISEAAERIGFRTEAVRLSMRLLLREALLPCILFWNKNHYVVLYEIKENEFFIADPARGLVQYSTKEFEDKWISHKLDGTEEGISLILEPTSVFYQNP